MHPDFSHVETWIFDLDNTLYPPGDHLFSQIEARMVPWIAQYLQVDLAEADRLRGLYWEKHGTTMAGLIKEHGLEPQDFLDEVHDIDFSILAPNPDLALAIEALPGRKIVFTNAPMTYAKSAITSLGLDSIFHAIYGVELARYTSKPAKVAFDHVFGLDDLSPKTAAMFEDDPRNLLVPYEMGVRTIHVSPSATVAPHIDAHTDDLRGFLKQIVA